MKHKRDGVQSRGLQISLPIRLRVCTKARGRRKPVQEWDMKKKRIMFQNFADDKPEKIERNNT